MELEASKITYSSRSGLKVEWLRSGVVSLSFAQAHLILMLLKSDLSQDELDEKFEMEDQRVILRYQQAVYEKMRAVSEEYDKVQSLKKVLRDLKELLDWWSVCLTEEGHTLWKDFFGWTIAPEPEVESRIRQYLKNGQGSKGFFTHLLKEALPDKPSAKTMERLEKRYGKFNLDSI